MKKLISIVLLLIMASFAYAEDIDLSGMSYTELVNLKNRINLAIWQSEEWQEVTVPQGTWKVGEHIPAGHWTVKAHTDTWATNISWGERLSDNGETISYWGRFSMSNTVYNPNNKSFDPINDMSTYSFEVREGDYISIIYGAAIFMPYAGTEITFGFK